MPLSVDGAYTLPSIYNVLPTDDILTTQVTQPFEDIRDALNLAFYRDGRAALTGNLRAVSGTAASPAIQFASASSTGIYYDAAGPALVVVVNGVESTRFLTSGAEGGIPIGTGTDYWGSTAPSRWLFAYGQAVSRATYAALFAVFGTTYGVGDGSTTFNLPDKRDRASFGKGDMGGTPANRITNQAGGWEGDTLGAAGGAQTHTLTSGQMPAHSHGGNTGSNGSISRVTDVQPNTTVQVANGVGPFVITSLNVTSSASANHTHTIGSEGGDQAHNNLPPGIVCNYIIFAGV